MANTTYTGKSQPRRILLLDGDYTCVPLDFGGALVVANGAAVSVTLLAAQVGRWMCLFAKTAHAITIKPDGTDYVNYASCDAQDWLYSDGSAGAAIVIQCIAAGVWDVLGDPKGVWARTTKP